MNDTLIVTVFVVLDDAMQALGHQTHTLAEASDSEVLTVAVVAAAQFQNHHERALCVLRALGYLSGPLSVSRFNRRLHALADWLPLLLDLLGELLATGQAYVMDSLPVPACRRARAKRCKKVQGAEFYGYCAAKEEPGALWAAYGWRLHLLCSDTGVPVGFDLLPASCHDLTPLYDWTQRVPGEACLYGDKAYNSGDDEVWIAAETSIRVIPIRKANMLPNAIDERHELRRMRAVVEGANSQLAAWGVERLHARTQEGFVIKVFASVFALLVVNAF